MNDDYTTVHLVRELDILTVQVNASAPAEAAQMLGRYIHADVYITADERGVCTAQRAIAQELLGDANEKAARASRIMAAAASREQGMNARDAAQAEPLTDEPGKVTKLTGPDSVLAHLQERRRRELEAQANPLVGDVMCNEWPAMAAGPCCLVAGHGGRHEDGSGQTWPRN